MTDVVVVGSLHLDVMVRAPRLPGLDETAVGSDWAFASGGKGRNQAAQAAAAGARTAMIGRVGDDEFGRILLASLDAAGVECSEVAVDPASRSGMSVAIVTGSGEYGAVIVSGANLGLEPAGLAASLDRIGLAPVLVLQNEIPEVANRAAAALAHRQGARVLLNAAPARAHDAELLDLVDVLIVNRVEAAQMSGLPVHDTESATSAARALASERRRVVVTLGGDGLVAVEANAPVLVLPAEKVEVVSTHGAGDCFVGTLAARLAAGGTLEAACRSASLAAARHVSTAHAG
jgi:ribokinase